MVFVWSQLTRGDESYTLLQVSVNDIVMVFAFAPIVAFLLGVTDIVVPWGTLVLSVVLFVALPLIAGLLTRRYLRSAERIEAFQAGVKPWSIIGLIATVVILFGLQGQVILDRPLIIALIAVPILLQSYGIFALAYAAAYALKVPHRIAAPCALIGTSNFFELAVAVAISLFGLNSGAALATVVGVLVEVPVMLSLVAFTNRTRSRFVSEPVVALSNPLTSSSAVKTARSAGTRSTKLGTLPWPTKTVQPLGRSLPLARHVQRPSPRIR